LPVHHHIDDGSLVQRGLSNYWGYESIGFLARTTATSSMPPSEQIVEFKTVFNHTAEGDRWGPTLAFRGLDNASYYRLQSDPRLYVDDSAPAAPSTLIASPGSIGDGLAEVPG
jgi:isoamylase